MASSNFSMSERNVALLKKFQGNGWALTCSPESQHEFSAMLGDAASAAQEESKATASEFPIVRYESDWADLVLARSLRWRAVDGSTPLWVTKATEGSDFALFQLPSPDRRWIVKFAGRILEPFSPRFLAWEDLHEIMVHGFQLDRNVVMDSRSSLTELRKRREIDLLRNAELIQPEPGLDDAVLQCSVSGTKLHGLDTQTNEGKIVADRWRTCADDFNGKVQKGLDRVFDTIRRKDELAASVIKKAVHCRNGYWSFSDSETWITTLGDVPYDANMVLTGKNWEIDFPDK